MYFIIFLSLRFHIYCMYVICDEIIIYSVYCFYVAIAILLIRQVIRVTSSTWQVRQVNLRHQIRREDPSSRQQ